MLVSVTMIGEQEYGSEGYCRRKTFGIRVSRCGWGKDEDETLARGWIAIVMRQDNCSSNVAYIVIDDARWIDARFDGLLAGFSLSGWAEDAENRAWRRFRFGRNFHITTDLWPFNRNVGSLIGSIHVIITVHVKRHNSNISAYKFLLNNETSRTYRIPRLPK